MDNVEVAEQKMRVQLHDAIKEAVENPSLDANLIDLYAKPIEVFQWARELIPGLIVSSAGGSHPYQAEGLLLDKYPFYYRSEWGYCSINIGEENGTTPYLVDHSLWTARLEVEASTHRGFVAALPLLLNQIRQSPYYWEFPCWSVIWEENGTRWNYEIDTTTQTTVGGWGETVEEGFASAMAPSEYLMEKGFTAERQVELFWKKCPSRTPVRDNVRNYPDKTPNFLQKEES